MYNQAVKDNIDTVDRRIISTVEQLRAVKEAIDGWEPDTVEEKQGIKQFETYARLSSADIN